MISVSVTLLHQLTLVRVSCKPSLLRPQMTLHLHVLTPKLPSPTNNLFLQQKQTMMGRRMTPQAFWTMVLLNTIFGRPWRDNNGTTLLWQHEQLVQMPWTCLQLRLRTLNLQNSNTRFRKKKIYFTKLDWQDLNDLWKPCNRITLNNTIQHDKWQAARRPHLPKMQQERLHRYSRSVQTKLRFHDSLRFSSSFRPKPLQTKQRPRTLRLR